MFKSVISSFQSFGKAVFTRIVGFVGGIFGIKPEVVQIPAPPEIINETVNNSKSETTEEKEEGFIKKSLGAAKKAASATIKAVQTVLMVSAKATYMAVRYATPVVAYSLAWDYAVSSGLVTLFMTFWNMGTIPYFITCALILIGVGTMMIAVETLWGGLLYPVKRLLFRSKKQAQTEVEPVQSKEDEEIGFTEGLAEMAFYVIETVEKIVQQSEKRLGDRLSSLEKAIIATPEVVITAPAVVTTPTPVTTTETEVVLTAVDSSPVVNTTPTEEVVPVVIEIEDEVEETVDSSPVPPTNINHPLSMLFVLDEATLTQELTELNMEAIKKMIVALNSHLKAPQKVSSHPPKNTPKGEGKNVLINRIKRQVKDIRANNQMVAA